MYVLAPLGERRKKYPCISGLKFSDVSGCFFLARHNFFSAAQLRVSGKASWQVAAVTARTLYGLGVKFDVFG